MEHKIFVAVYLPYTTYRLQPLDVSLFSPLAVYYSQELSTFIYESEGLCTVAKRDFFRLFWSAYTRAFTEANILSSFRRTGLLLLDRSLVID